MILETRKLQPTGDALHSDPALREMLLHDVYEVPEEVFEEIDAAISILCCPQCWETGLALETIPHKPDCPLRGTGIS